MKEYYAIRKKVKTPAEYIVDICFIENSPGSGFIFWVFKGQTNINMYLIINNNNIEIIYLIFGCTGNRYHLWVMHLPHIHIIHFDFC